MAKHLYTQLEIRARRADVRTLIHTLTKQGYGQTRVEAKDLHNLKLERAELTHLANTTLDNS